MKLILRTLGIFCLVLKVSFSSAQCGAGYTKVTLNWDNLDYFTYTGNYSSGYLSSITEAQIQNFAFGTQRLKVITNYGAAGMLGENTNHTAETGSKGTGADVQYLGNGVIKLSFQEDVKSVQFSLYDIDHGQDVYFGATDTTGAAKNISLGTLTGSILTIFNNNSTTARVESANTNVGNASGGGTVNVDIAGPVKNITITVINTGTDGSEDGSFYLSDITACSTGDFAANYYSVAKPFTNQKSYVLEAFDKSVYAVDPSTGFCRLLFTDATGLGNINSMGYDPYRRILYYVYSLTATPATNKAIKKYDFNTKTITTLVADVSSLTGLAIPLSTSGVESGGAAFYDGAFYLGIETSNAARTSGREAVIYRIDFNTSNVPFQASQVWAIPVDGTGTLLHDWSDFAITNGVLYDFDGAGVTTQTNVYHYNMITGLMNTYALPSWTPGQISIGWDNKIFQLYATSIAPTVNPYLAEYNGSGGIGTQLPLTSNPMYTPAIPSLGDAGEAFRFFCDFGDAPASYDPISGEPAVHEIIPLLSLGNNKDDEGVVRGQTSLANSDNFDDAVATVTTFNPLSATYLIQVPVYNNTGADATVCAWLDYNGNGIFDASEGITLTVATSTVLQYKYLYWPYTPSTLLNGTYTYLRIRITSASNNMTTSNPTGFYASGEVEDYRVPVNLYALSTKALSFEAEKSGTTAVSINWDAIETDAGTNYILQRSSNSTSWDQINITQGLQGKNSYTYFDRNPLSGRSYYRLKILNANGTSSYSEVRKVDFDSPVSLTLAPNPATSSVKLSISSDHATQGTVIIVDMTGRLIYHNKIRLQSGYNSVTLPTSQFPAGSYQVELQTDRGKYDERLIIKR